MKRLAPAYKIMDDPELDRIFTDAYREALSKVEGVEKEKRMADHIDAYAELFEQDLRRRDLTLNERTRIMSAFRRRLALAREEAGKRGLRLKKRAIIASSIGAGVLAIIMLFILATQPFRPVADIKAELASYYEKVDEGYGLYAKRYYALLNKYGAKLGPTTVADYRKTMETELDEHFLENLAFVEAGELRYVDDAKDWASYFPEKEDREERRRRVDNVFQAGMGKVLGGAWETVKQEAGKLFNEAEDKLKGLVDRLGPKD